MQKYTILIIIYDKYYKLVLLIAIEVIDTYKYFNVSMFFSKVDKFIFILNTYLNIQLQSERIVYYVIKLSKV